MANVGAVILAAGGSSRFGKPKQLVRFQGQTLLERAVDAAIGGGCQPVVVVTGSNATEIGASISGTSVSMVQNNRWADGIGTSICLGVQCLIELAPDSPAVVLLACDQPLVTGKTVEGLVQQWRKTGKAIVASSYSNTLGVPALFGSSCFQELMQLKQNSGAKPIILANRDRVADVHFPEGAGDIDTIEDYERLTSNR